MSENFPPVEPPRVVQFPKLKRPKLSHLGDFLPITDNENAVLFEIILPAEIHDDKKVVRKYVCTPKGVFLFQERFSRKKSRKNLKLITSSPVWVSRKFVSVEGETAFEIAYLVEKKLRKIVVPRTILLDKKALNAVVDADSFPVTSANFKDFVAYLSEIEKFAEISVFSRQCGWIDGEFVPYSRKIKFHPEQGFEQFQKAFSQTGNLEKQLELIRFLLAHPHALLVAVTGLVPPLLRIIGAPSFTLDISGRSTTGKTTALKVAASFWGNPQILVSPWNATRIFIEKLTAFLCDTPIFLDDSQESSQDAIQKVLYSIANEAGRGRANPAGVQKIRRWKTVLLSTGEQPVWEYSNWPGARVRTLSIQKAPFSGLSASDFLKLEKLYTSNYGWIAKLFIGVLQKVDGQTLREEYDNLVEEFSGQGEYRSRLAKFYASILLTARLLDDICENIAKFQGIYNTLVKFADELLDDHRGRSEEDFLADLWSWFLSNESEVGFRKDGVAYVYPHLLHQFLQQNRYPEAVIRNLAERGVLIRDKKRLKLSVKIKGQHCRVYAFKEDAIQKILS